MKKTFTVFLVIAFVTIAFGAAHAEERIVQLTIPGCGA